MTILAILIGVVVGAGTNILLPLVVTKGENPVSALIAYCKHSKRWNWLAWQLWQDDFENEYLDRVWDRMHQ